MDNKKIIFYVYVVVLLCFMRNSVWAQTQAELNEVAMAYQEAKKDIERNDDCAARLHYLSALSNIALLHLQAEHIKKQWTVAHDAFPPKRHTFALWDKAVLASRKACKLPQDSLKLKKELYGSKPSGSTSYQVYILWGKEHWAKQNYTDAAFCFTRAVALAEHYMQVDSAIYFNLAKAHLLANNYEKTAEYLGKCTADCQKTKPYIEIYVKVLLKKHKYNEAQLFLERALSQNTADEELRLSLVQLLVKQQKYKDALKHIESIKGYKESNYLTISAFIYAQLSEFAKADSLYRKSVQFDSGNYNANYNFGLFLYRQAQQKQSEKERVQLLHEAENYLSKAIGIRYNPKAKSTLMKIRMQLNSNTER